MNKATSCLVVLIAVLATSCGQAPDPIIDEYYARLDAWVEGGASLDRLQVDVVESCGKLLMAYSPAEDKAAAMTTNREGFDFWVDMCVKMTAHRVSPQPEFTGDLERAALVKETCDGHEMWRRLCDRAELGQ